MTEKYKRKLLRMRLIRLLLGATGTLSLLMTTHAVTAALPDDIHSPLMAQSQGTQATITKFIQTIKQAAGGKLDGKTTGVAFSEAVAAHPGIPINIVTAAISQMKLSGNVLAQAVHATATAYDVTTADVLGSIVTHSYMSGGKNAAGKTIAGLRTQFGDRAVNAALDNPQVTQLIETAQLAAIETASGDDASVYDG